MMFRTITITTTMVTAKAAPARESLDLTTLPCPMAASRPSLTKMMAMATLLRYV